MANHPAENRLKDLLSTEELSQFLGISIAGVYRMVESRQIPFLKVRKLLRFRRADVESFLQTRTVKPRDEYGL